MIIKKHNDTVATFSDFSPYLLFSTLYTILYYYIIKNNYFHNSLQSLMSGLPLFVVFVTILHVFATSKKHLNLNNKIDFFLDGVTNYPLIFHSFIFMLSTNLNFILAKTNSVTTAVTIGLIVIPSSWIIPSFFLFSSFLSIIIPSSLVTIITIIPISYGIACSLNINFALMTATVMSGVLCGTHISLHSDTIKAIGKSTQSNFVEIIKESLYIVIPSFIGTIILLSQFKHSILDPSIYIQLKSSLFLQDYITIIPYLLLILNCIIGINLLINLLIVSLIGIIIGILYGNFLFCDIICTMFDGFCGQKALVNLVVLSLFSFGLIKMIYNNGGFNYLLKKLEIKTTKNKYLKEFILVFVTSIMNMMIIIDTLSINLFEPFITKIIKKYNIKPTRGMSLFHITTTTIQLFLPYTLPILLVTYLTHTSYKEIIIYMIYPMLISLFTIISISINSII